MNQLQLISGVIVTFIFFVKAQDNNGLYSRRYERLDMNTILASPRLVTNYVDCLLNKKPCPPEGKALKRILPEALRTKCGKCWPSQKEGALKVITALYYDYPNHYNALRQKWDQTGEYNRKFEEYLRDQNFNSIGSNNNVQNTDINQGEQSQVTSTFVENNNNRFPKIQKSSPPTPSKPVRNTDFNSGVEPVESPKQNTATNLKSEPQRIIKNLTPIPLRMYKINASSLTRPSLFYNVRRTPPPQSRQFEQLHQDVTQRPIRQDMRTTTTRKTNWQQTTVIQVQQNDSDIVNRFGNDQNANNISSTVTNINRRMNQNHQNSNEPPTTKRIRPNPPNIQPEMLPGFTITTTFHSHNHILNLINRLALKFSNTADFLTGILRAVQPQRF